MKVIFYVHDTPLAGLAAHMHTGFADREEAASAERMAFLDLPEHLLRAGMDSDGATVYAIWMREADPELLKRLVQSFLSINEVAPDSYEIRVVPTRGRLGLVGFLFKHGLYGAGQRLLAGWDSAALKALVPAPGID